ncbi:MAG TPA: thioredoxin-dependent thiol peroxidase [Bellilinea sp.]|nr:thioredoxin-dependent thiol peroxidase [Bellilinea sp.]
MITEKSKAPGFKLKDQDGNEVTLEDFKGKKVVLYFYPKDDTTGCTLEAKGFRDNYDAFGEKGVTVLGISPDSVQSHKKFASKYELPFTLLVDEGHKVAEEYGVWGKKKMYGKEYEGILRTTFLIDEQGKIEKVFPNVKPADHAAEILNLFK